MGKYSLKSKLTAFFVGTGGIAETVDCLLLFIFLLSVFYPSPGHKRWQNEPLQKTCPAQLAVGESQFKKAVVRC